MYAQQYAYQLQLQQQQQQQLALAPAKAAFVPLKPADPGCCLCLTKVSNQSMAARSQDECILQKAAKDLHLSEFGMAVSFQFSDSTLQSRRCFC